jgi:hypothetical protein
MFPVGANQVSVCPFNMLKFQVFHIVRMLSAVMAVISFSGVTRFSTGLKKIVVKCPA